MDILFYAQTRSLQRFTQYLVLKALETHKMFDIVVNDNDNILFGIMMIKLLDVIVYSIPKYYYMS